MVRPDIASSAHLYAMFRQLDRLSFADMSSAEDTTVALYRISIIEIVKIRNCGIGYPIYTHGITLYITAYELMRDKGKFHFFYSMMKETCNTLL